MPRNAPAVPRPEVVADKDRRINRILWAVVGILAIAVVAVALFKAWPLLYPDISERAPLNRECDLIAGPCGVRFAAGGEVVLDILPRGVPALHPLTITASLVGLPAPQRVEVELGSRNTDRVEVLDGLAPGDRVSLERRP